MPGAFDGAGQHKARIDADGADDRAAHAAARAPSAAPCSIF
jgi:hypothetical protein